MISANIYSLERLSSEDRNAIGGGLELLGEQIGGIGINKFLRVSPAGNGSHARIKGLDHMVELHMFHVPTGSQVVSGRAEYGSGLGIVGSANMLSSSHGKESTTAHEAAHALGYTLREGSHCPDANCIMYPIQDPVSNILNGILKDFAATLPNEVQEVLGDDQFSNSFCGDCVHEIQTTHEQKIGQLRLERLAKGSINPFIINLA